MNVQPMFSIHNGDVIMGTIASQITSLVNVFSTVSLDTDQRKHQGSASLAFVWGIHGGPVNSPHKWPVTRKMFPFDDVIIRIIILTAAVYVVNEIVPSREPRGIPYFSVTGSDVHDPIWTLMCSFLKIWLKPIKSITSYSKRLNE